MEEQHSRLLIQEYSEEELAKMSEKEYDDILVLSGLKGWFCHVKEYQPQLTEEQRRASDENQRRIQMIKKSEPWRWEYTVEDWLRDTREDIEAEQRQRHRFTPPPSPPLAAQTAIAATGLNIAAAGNLIAATSNVDVIAEPNSTALDDSRTGFALNTTPLSPQSIQSHSSLASSNQSLRRVTRSQSSPMKLFYALDSQTGLVSSTQRKRNTGHNGIKDNGSQQIRSTRTGGIRKAKNRQGNGTTSRSSGKASRTTGRTKTRGFRDNTKKAQG